MNKRLKDQIAEICKVYSVLYKENVTTKIVDLFRKNGCLTNFWLEYSISLSFFDFFTKIQTTFAILSELKELEAPIIISEHLLRSIDHIFCENNALKSQICGLTTKYWDSIDPEVLFLYTKICNLNISEEDLIIYASYLILIKKYEKAGILGKNFGILVKSKQETLQKNFGLFDLLIKTDDLKVLKTLIKDNKNLSFLAVQSLSNNYNIKEAESIIKNFNFDWKSFPGLLKKRIEKSLGFLYKSNTPVYQLIELVENSELALSVLIEFLINSEIESIKLVGHYLIKNHPNCSKNIETQFLEKICKENVAFFNKNDEFSPSSPVYYRLPSTVKVIFVDSLDLLKSLSFDTEKIISLDSEWKINIGTTEFNPTSILQIGCRSTVYIIDLINCHIYPELDRTLYDLFQNPEIIKIGISFKNDLTRLKQSYPSFVSFSQNICNYIDLIHLFAQNFNFFPGGLAGLSEICLSTSLCKQEQKSNWEKRPLRLSQIHYAACDVAICIEIYNHFEKTGLNLNRHDENKGFSIKNKKKVEFCEFCKTKGHATENCIKYIFCSICGKSEHRTEDCDFVVIVNNS